ncbi:hypothetical protein [Olsenella sp. HMSC062G07]|uniref:hypothetical protein n=1 Tax=Olsenella sp. HMSC062G07 TaxID=1739330 RepID=UPI0008A3821E|nr:hypothetical protein [Olsenella sp. HMSC062G07]OFK24996.1 hypothetical protein HMPREF2826_03445 [Olsenella sp. HMSC062G07]
MTERQAGFMISAELGDRGVPDASWKYLSRSTQRDLFAKALTRRKPTERELRRANIKPVNESLYNAKKNYVERHGGVVMRGGEDVERHLDVVGADASHLPGIIMLRERPTTSDVLEEVFHFQQEERGDYNEYGAEVRRLLRERDAQKHLIGVAERYNIPESETRQTELALEYYLRKLKEAGIDERD